MIVGLLSTSTSGFTALDLVESPRYAWRLVRWMTTFLMIAIVFMALAPWRQTSRGSGRVIAFHPTERPQTVQSPIYGRLVRWSPGIAEGVPVKEGQIVVEIRDNDPARAERLRAQVEAVRRKMELAREKSAAYERQVQDLLEARNMVVEAGEQLVEEARRKLEAERHALQGAVAGERQTLSNFDRQRKLFEAGFTSGVNFERDRRSYEEAQAKVAASQQYVGAAENYLNAKQAELHQKSREAQTKVDYARAMQQEALGEMALAEKELLESEGKLAQFGSRLVAAPRDGVIFRLHANDNAEMLKEGDPLFTIVPQTTSRAVELFVDGNDLPLVTVGREVRLQFEGWPSLQFAAGWPHAALGTFGGIVAAVDATDDGKGKFRVLVRPDEAQDWPAPGLLAQGVLANGWVVLNEVSLGYEIWRQLNGFPAVYGEGEVAESRGKDVKKVKLPK